MGQAHRSSLVTFQPDQILGGRSMNALVVLAFMLWLHMGISIVLAQFSALILTALVSLVLTAYVQRIQQPVS